MYLSNILNNWNPESPTKALAFLQGEFPAGKLRNEATASVAYQWARNDPHAALEWMMSSPDATEIGFANSGTARVFKGPNASAYSVAVETWAQRDPQAALAWALALPEGAWKTPAVVSAIGGLSHTDPAQAAELAASLPAGESKTKASISLAAFWAERDSAAAAQWAGQIADPALRTDALFAIVGTIAHYSPSDPLHAATLLETLPAGSKRDQLIQDVAYNIASKDPARAVRLATSVGGENERAQALENAFRGWKKSDEAAAKRWFSAVPGISPKRKKDLLDE